IFVTGNPIFEVLRAFEREIEESGALVAHGLEPGSYLLATMHRAENVDDPAVFAALCGALATVADLYEMPLILSVHPRIKLRLKPDTFGGSRVIPADAMPF